MDSFFSFLKVFVVCGTVFFVIMLVLLAVPQSRLRCVGLEMAKYGLCCGFILLTASPLDLIPDVIPGLGWCDDVGYLIGAVCAAKSALGERKKRLLYEEIELKELQERAKE